MTSNNDNKCPHCGTIFSNNQKFCSVCGLNLNHFKEDKKSNLLIVFTLSILALPLVLYLVVNLYGIILEHTDKNICSTKKAKSALDFALKQEYPKLSDKDLTYGAETLTSSEDNYICSSFVYNTGKELSPPQFNFKYNKKNKEVSNLKIVASKCDDEIIKINVLDAFMENVYFLKKDLSAYEHTQELKYSLYLQYFKTTNNLYFDVVDKEIINIQTQNNDISNSSCSADILLTIKDRAFTELVCPIQYETKICDGSFDNCYSLNSYGDNCTQRGRNENEYKKFNEKNNIKPEIRTNYNETVSSTNKTNKTKTTQNKTYKDPIKETKDTLFKTNTNSAKEVENALFN